MKKNIIANRVMIFMGIYSVLSLILLYYCIAFTVVFPNVFNRIMMFTVVFVIFLLPYLFYQTVIVTTRKLDHNFRQFYHGQNMDGLRGSDISLTSEMAYMMDYILQLSENIQSIKMSDLHSKYRALQNQINPHFLYNTLEAVRSDALIAGNDEIADITEALATFFRYSISGIENLVTIEDELVNVRNYFKIQNYRFGDKINLSISYSDKLELLKTDIPKLTLQPIIENAIIHGLEHKVDHGQIAIKIHETQNRVLIDVIDDGVGLDEEQLSLLNNRMKLMGDHLLEKKMKKGGIALMNVNNRIKLTFGEIYGLRISSVKEYGTTVNVSLPKRTMGKS